MGLQKNPGNATAAGNRRALDAVYRATSYCARGADLPGALLTLRVGDRNPLLDQWLGTRGERAWAYLTAANPASTVLPEAENTARQAALAQMLTAEGYPFWPGESLADAGDWPAEPGFLVLGIDSAAAGELARRWGQNALLCGRLAEPARLVWVTD